MSVIARDPDVGIVPVAEVLGIVTNTRDELVDDPDRVADDRCLVPLGVRGLVDPGERRENEFGALLAHSPNDLFDDVAIEVEPTADIPAEVRSRHTRCRAQGAKTLHTEGRDAPAGRESAADHAQGADAMLGKLEYRRRCRIDVGIDAAHLVTDVAP